MTHRKIGFVIASCDHGTMIVNRFDYRMVNPTAGYGVGHQIFETSSYDQTEVFAAIRLLDLRRQHYGDNVHAIDCGANIGVHTVEWARHMTGWGSVVAIEPQEPVYYALAGNIAINNCFNARAYHAAVGATVGQARVPRADYLTPGSFGSLELKRTPRTEFIGQWVDYDNTYEVRALTLDSLKLPRADLLKIDVEGMEVEVLEGAASLITTHYPIMMIEATKTDTVKLVARLKDWNYRTVPLGMNVVAIHADDPCISAMRP